MHIDTYQYKPGLTGWEKNQHNSVYHQLSSPNWSEMCGMSMYWQFPMIAHLAITKYNGMDNWKLDGKKVIYIYQSSGILFEMQASQCLSYTSYYFCIKIRQWTCEQICVTVEKTHQMKKVAIKIVYLTETMYLIVIA